MNLEHELFLEIRKKLESFTTSLQTLAINISHIDVYLSLAIVALEYDYIRPELTLNRNVEIRDGRHPVVEKQQHLLKMILLWMKEKYF